MKKDVKLKNKFFDKLVICIYTEEHPFKDPYKRNLMNIIIEKKRGVLLEKGSRGNSKRISSCREKLS